MVIICVLADLKFFSEILEFSSGVPERWRNIMYEFFFS